MSRRLRLVFLTLAGPVLLAMLLTAIERSMLFPAPELAPQVLAAEARRQGATELQLQAADGTQLYGWRLTTPGEARGLVLYFSGNGSTVAAPEARYRRYVAAGFDVVHVNYRGYPGSRGQPSETGLLQDAHAAWLEARRSHPAGQILVHGKSLGGGVALGLLAQLDAQPRALVIESSFTSAVDVGAEAFPWLPVRLVMRQRFDSLARAPAVACPTLVLHGTADELIGVHHARRLAEALPDARLVEIPGAGHNDDLLAWPAAWEALLDLAR